MGQGGRANEVTVEDKTISYQEFKVLSQDMSEMKSLMSKMVEAINRIALLDERQQAVAHALQKLDERMGRMEEKQQQAEVARALTQASADRLNLIDAGFRELHIERERDKARFATVVWMVRGLWGVAGAGGAIAIIKLIAGAA